MSKPKAPPDELLIEFFSSSWQAITYADLGPEFIATHKLSGQPPLKPFRIAAQRKTSKAGNAYYEYSQNSMPFPDGLYTFVRVAGAPIPMGRVRPSKKGYPTREGTTQVLVGSTPYTVIGYLTESRNPFWVKVVAHKTPDSTAGLKRAQAAPRGGRFA